MVARVGGDEFLILQRGIDGAEKVQRLTETILSSFAAEMDLSRDPMAVGVSIGVSLFPKDAADADTLRQNADVALYRAKMSGRGTASFFDHELDQTVRNRRALEHDLRHALLRDQMRLVYQPLVATGAPRSSAMRRCCAGSIPNGVRLSPTISSRSPRIPASSCNWANGYYARRAAPPPHGRRR